MNPAAKPSPALGRGWYLPAAMIIMLLAAFFRMQGLADTPLGLSDEEMVSARIAERIISEGDIRLIYDNVSPAREGVYYAGLAASSIIFGKGLMLWRLPSVWIALVTIALSMRLMRELFGVRVALFTAGLLAVAFWPIWLGRAVLHVTLVPLFACLTLFLFARGYRAAELTQSSLWFTLGGLSLGFTLYVHVTAWTVPVILGLFVLYRLFVRHEEFTYHWSNIVYAAGLTVVISLPLIIYLFNNPGAREPVPLAEQPDLIASLPGRLLSTASALVLRGDEMAVHNLPGRPIMGVGLFALAVIGVGVALARVRRPEYGLILIWAGVGLIPTALLPSTDYEIMAVVLPVLFVFPAVGLRELYWATLQTVPRQTIKVMGGAVVFLVITSVAVFTYRDFFLRWAALDEVAAAYNSDFGRIAQYIDSTPDPTPVSVCSIPTGQPLEPSNEDFMRIMVHRGDINIRYFDCRSSLIIADGGRPQRMIFPNSTYYSLLPGPLLGWMTYADPIAGAGLPPDSLVRFEAEEAIATQAGAFITTAPTAWPPEAGGTRLAPLPITFDFNIDFLGYTLRDATIQPQQTVDLVTYWRINGDTPPNLTMFAHLLGNPIVIIAQSDGFGARTASLQPRDIVLQHSVIATPAALTEGLYPLAVGLYFPDQIDQRLFAYEGGEGIANRIFLQRVEVVR